MKMTWVKGDHIFKSPLQIQNYWNFCDFWKTSLTQKLMVILTLCFITFTTFDKSLFLFFHCSYKFNFHNYSFPLYWSFPLLLTNGHTLQTCSCSILTDFTLVFKPFVPTVSYTQLLGNFHVSSDASLQHDENAVTWFMFRYLTLITQTGDGCYAHFILLHFLHWFLCYL